MPPSFNGYPEEYLTTDENEAGDDSRYLRAKAGLSVYTYMDEHDAAGDWLRLHDKTERVAKAQPPQETKKPRRRGRWLEGKVYVRNADGTKTRLPLRMS